MCVVGSGVNRQRKYIERLKRENPGLLKSREREKWRRRCMKRKLSTGLPKIAEPACYKQPSPLVFGAKQHELSEHGDYSRNMNNTCLKRMYLVDEDTYRNYLRQVAATRAPEERPAMKQNVSSRLENAEQNQDKMLLRLPNSMKKLMSFQSSPDSSRPGMPLTERLSRDVMEGIKPACMSVCDKVVKKKRKVKGKHIRNARRRTAPIMWDPL